MHLKSIVSFILTLCCLIANGQTDEESFENETQGKHSLGLFIAHSYISRGVIDGEMQWLSAPSFALNYNYRLNDRWSIGLHNDIIIESFIVEDRSSSNEEFFERESPISNILVSTYKLTESWGVAAGAGIDWEKNENFTMIRLGTEYGRQLKDESFEIVFSLNYDILINAYDIINFGIGINKFFK